MKKNIVQGREVGSIYSGIEFKGTSFNRYGVFVHGDGTLQGDTVCLGIFWEPETAEWFAEKVKAGEILKEKVEQIRSTMEEIADEQ